MAKSAYNLEAVIGHGLDAKTAGIHTVIGQDEYIRSKLPPLQETPEEIRAFFEARVPGKNVTKFTAEEFEQRQLEHVNASNAYITIGAEYGAITLGKGTPRSMATLYRPERTQEDIDFNNHLRDAFNRNDYAEVGRIYGEHIMNLPSYDPEMLQNLSNMEAPWVLRDLYPLHCAVQEGNKILNTSDDEIEIAIRNAMSPESRARLAELVRDMDVFSSFKIHCDHLSAPYYPYVDVQKVVKNNEDPMALTDVGMGDGEYLGNFSFSLNNDITYLANGLGRNTEIALKNAGLDPDQTVARDFTGQSGDFLYFGTEVLRRGEPLFCTCNGQVKAFVNNDGMPKEVNPAEAMDKITRDIVKKTDEVLNGSVADPLWLLTGSAEYRGMKSALAEFKKAGQIDSPEAAAALTKLQTSAEAYFTRKNVNLEECPDFDAFKENDPKAADMSERELARMEAAYKMLDIGKSAASTAEMRKELSAMPTYFEPTKPQPVYAERVRLAHDAAKNFLKDPIPAADGVTAGEKLRQDLNKTLLDPETGFMNKKFFTKEDREATNDILAKAVILDMIRSGREITKNSPVAIERAYNDAPKETLDAIKGTTAFREAAKNINTPESMGKFFASNRQVSVNKEISTGAAQQHKVVQNQAQAQQMQLSQQAPVMNGVQAAPAQPQPQPVPPPMG